MAQFLQIDPTVKMVCQGIVRHGTVWSVMVRYGMVWHNMEHYSTLVMAKVPVSAGLDFTWYKEILAWHFVHSKHLVLTCCFSIVWESVLKCGTELTIRIHKKTLNNTPHNIYQVPCGPARANHTPLKVSRRDNGNFPKLEQPTLKHSALSAAQGA